VQWPYGEGAIVPVVTLEGLKPGELVFDGEIARNLYLGKITQVGRSGDCQLNPQLKLPTDAIPWCAAPTARETTFNFTDYLSKASSDWKTKVGSGTAVEWPAALAPAQ